MNDTANRLIVLKSIDSTNAYCLRHAGDLPEGTVVVADRQTQGRGRRDRAWHSPAGNLFLSLLLRPPFGRLDLPQVPLVAGLSAWDAVRQFGVGKAWLKWPNDVWVGERKLAGILCESGAADGREVVVVGIGINLNMSRQELAQVGRPATSVRAETGRRIVRDEAVRLLLERWAERFDAARTRGFTALLPAWQRADGLVGRAVQVDAGSRSVHGEVTGLEADGRLTVRRSDGRVECFSSGEVSLRPLP